LRAGWFAIQKKVEEFEAYGVALGVESVDNMSALLDLIARKKQRACPASLVTELVVLYIV
jgi:hypothetical protein